MNATPPRPGLLALLILSLAMVLPVAAYYLTIARAPSVSCRQARSLLANAGTLVVTLDLPPDAVRTLDPYPVFDTHFHSLMDVQSQADLPPALRDHTLLLLCPGGIQSALAASHLHSLGVAHVYSIRDGLQEWIASSADTHDPSRALAFRPAPLHEEVIALLAFFGLKTIYTVLAAGIIIVLRRRSAPDLVQLRWSIIAFFLGEACCAVNVLGFHERSMLLEYLHSYGMVLALAFATCSLLSFIDLRLIHCTDEVRCALLSLCQAGGSGAGGGGCIKHAAVPCRLRRLFLILIPATAILAALPLCSGYRYTTYNTLILTHLHTYHHPILAQVYELRILPLAAIFLLAAALIILLFYERRRFPLSKLLFSAAAGALGFSLLRLLIVAAFIENQVYFALWEELTELLFIGAIAGFLWVFRRALLPPRASAQKEHP